MGDVGLSAVGSAAAVDPEALADEGEVTSSKWNFENFRIEKCLNYYLKTKF